MTNISEKLWSNVEAEWKSSLGKYLNTYMPHFSAQEVHFDKWIP